MWAPGAQSGRRRRPGSARSRRHTSWATRVLAMTWSRFRLRRGRRPLGGSACATPCDVTCVSRHTIPVEWEDSVVAGTAPSARRGDEAALHGAADATGGSLDSGHRPAGELVVGHDDRQRGDDPVTSVRHGDGKAGCVRMDKTGTVRVSLAADFSQEASRFSHNRDAVDSGRPERREMSLTVSTRTSGSKHSKMRTMRSSTDSPDADLAMSPFSPTPPHRVAGNHASGGAHERSRHGVPADVRR